MKTLLQVLCGYGFLVFFILLMVKVSKKGGESQSKKEEENRSVEGFVKGGRR